MRPINLPFELPRYMGKNRNFLNVLSPYEVKSEKGSYWLMTQAPKFPGHCLLVAHLDTVQIPQIYGRLQNRLYGCGFDDRLGVAVAMALFSSRLDCDILLTDFEEKGKSTAVLVPTEALRKYTRIFGLDRGGMDFVDYDLSDESLISAAEKYLKTEIAFGSFSDICFLENPACSCLNLGLGHYGSHDQNAFVEIAETAARYQQINDLITATSQGVYPAPEKTAFSWKGYGREWKDDFAFNDDTPWSYSIKPPSAGEYCEWCLDVLLPEEKKNGICDACKRDQERELAKYSKPQKREKTWALK